jgi:hypothetical protein
LCYSLHRPTYHSILSQFSKYYLQLGSFHFTSFSLTNTHVEAGTNTNGNKYVYFGEMEDGSTTTRKGRGIKIFSDKEVNVGHYENDEIIGQARAVYDGGA